MHVTWKIIGFSVPGASALRSRKVHLPRTPTTTVIDPQLLGPIGKTGALLQIRMDARSLARGLRAQPTRWLFSPRQLPRMQQPFLNTLRYNSSSSSPQTPVTQTITEAATTATSSPQTATPGTQAQTKNVASDFDEILNKLDLGNRAQTDSTNRNRRAFSDSMARSVGLASPQGSRDHTGQQLASRKTELKLGPTLGRQVHVEPERGVDLAAAIRTLQVTCNANKIKQQSIEQKFHVRKGMVRKQLRRTRWRKLFRFSFQETVKKIQRMQAQGW